MWFAGIGWGPEGYDITVVDDAGAPVATSRFAATGIDEPVGFLRSLAERSELVSVIDSTNGVLDGSLMAAGLDVYRADPWDTPARPPFGSASSDALAGLGRDALARLTRLDIGSGTLGGRDDEADADIERSGPLERRLAAQGGLLFHGSRAHPRVALTFDDGPHPVNTPRILDVLRRYRVPATFFCVGLHAQAFPDLLRRIVDEGHLVGNHTWSHPYLPDLSREEVLRQIGRTGEVLGRAGGGTPSLVRPPYGGRSPEVLDWLAEEGLTTVLWDVEPCDWAMGGAAAIAGQVVDEADFGSVILLHDGGGDRSQTVEALPMILESMMARGCRFVTVDQLAPLRV
ncbi:Peptidoglycan/xylan/chitin deacetylase, PgdA/CDA1 family [Streptosporangium subroseum]|uniref:Peptidoglycan/xylan/chitin deacetylase, PgdA/CDA1 family n=1 Tax=Streptosporangium subroseum TaxID=106412 RepID=A0A239FZT0_9ACTN|nr:polysaccharide deacetylase family protein [Streptosporangium subroseum]SNS62411.1 Peptidoglycan/xylan/chitin deacetylase, PgdA/CDA1 family [Streptosporangium subroseum]